MQQRNLMARIRNAEKVADTALVLAKTETKFSPDCTCWPDNERPFFGSAVMREIAAQVECPLHGKRSFSPAYHLYAAKWFREKQQQYLSCRSQQYQKAWNASFTPELWPAEEEESSDGEIFLSLKTEPGFSLAARLLEGPSQPDRARGSA
jgi:hypothetical protein